ncbi:MAG: regulatory signaling modulator protein AmpE [Gammaproteobacteria bacterium]
MNFIAIILALLVEHFYKPVVQWRNYQWFTQYEQWVYNKLEGRSFRDGPVAVILIFGVIISLAWIITAALYDFFGLFGFLFATVVLIYCIGPTDLDEDVQGYLADIESGDAEGANHKAENILGYTVSDKPAVVAVKVKEAIFIQGNNRMLGVLCWFVLLGPAGALLFRFSEIHSRTCKVENTGYADACNRLFYILSWLPARISVLGYAIVGNFVDTMSKWQGMSDIWQADNDELVVTSGLGALKHDESKASDEADITGVLDALALVKRTLVFWLAVLAIFTLTGILF